MEIALYGVIFTRCLCQEPSLARTSLVRVFTQTTREYNPVRRTFHAVNYTSGTVYLYAQLVALQTRSVYLFIFIYLFFSFDACSLE